jgi:choline dehydrogenase-like flavoprotein
VPLGRLDEAIDVACTSVGIDAASLYDIDARGFGAVSLMQFDGRRVDRSTIPNVMIRAHGTVDRVAVDDRNTAQGVILDDATFVAARHVVLSCGAVGTPLLLWRSGVTLLGIGMGLQDHAGVQIRFHVPEEFASASGTPAIRSGARWHDGDLQLLVMNHLGEPGPFAALSVALMRPHSRGRLVLEADSTALLDLQLLTDERDRCTLREGVRTAVRVLSDLSNSISAKVIDNTGETDDEIDQWMLENTRDWFHATGTCRMGDQRNELSVVDPNCAVIGYSALSVIDASILPSSTSANTQVPVTAVARHAALRLALGLNPSQ